LQDAIAAISTPPGEGGIAIVRLSGNKVIETVDKLFKPFRRDVELVKRPSHTLTLGWIIDEEGNPLDEVLVSIMREPTAIPVKMWWRLTAMGELCPPGACWSEFCIWVYGWLNPANLPAGLS